MSLQYRFPLKAGQVQAECSHFFTVVIDRLLFLCAASDRPFAFGSSGEGRLA
jgi:hypothetical protein